MKQQQRIINQRRPVCQLPKNKLLKYPQIQKQREEDPIVRVPGGIEVVLGLGVIHGHAGIVAGDGGAAVAEVTVLKVHRTEIGLDVVPEKTETGGGRGEEVEVQANPIQAHPLRPGDERRAGGEGNLVIENLIRHQSYQNLQVAVVVPLLQFLYPRADQHQFRQS